MHRINGSVQALLQQTPLAQKPVPHCDGVAQAPPCGTGLAVGVLVTVDVAVRVAVCVAVLVLVAVAVIVAVAVTVGVSVGVSVGVNVGGQLGRQPSPHVVASWPSGQPDESK